MSNTIITIIDSFQSGRLKTAKDFSCRDCGGFAHAQAVLNEEGTHAGLLAVSLFCENCGNGIQADGVSPWPGWERIALLPEQQLDPHASLRSLKAHFGESATGKTKDNR